MKTCLFASGVKLELRLVPDFGLNLLTHDLGPQLARAELIHLDMIPVDTSSRGLRLSRSQTHAIQARDH